MKPMPRRFLLLVSAALFVACATTPRVSESQFPRPLLARVHSLTGRHRSG